MKFKLPDLGEGLPDAEIVEWHVQVGDKIKVDQTLVSMQTAKAIVELPSPISGHIVKLYGNPGDIVKTGDPLVEFENDQEDTKNEENISIAGKLETNNTVITEKIISTNSNSNQKRTIKVTPAVRALAQSLKVDLTHITPSGPNNTITLQDVQTASELKQMDLEPLKGVRRAMAEVMDQAHREVVPVTVVEDAKLLNWSKEEDISVRLIQAITIACRKQPALNAWYEGRTLNRKLIQEVHLGIAMDTVEGLFVPVIRNAETLNSKQLREKIEQLKIQVQDRTIPLEDLRGATFTLSNFGKFVGRYANPIVVPPMVAILGAGKLRNEVVSVQDKPMICPVLPLSLTFDHRAVTGGEAAQFLNVVIQTLES